VDWDLQQTPSDERQQGQWSLHLTGIKNTVAYKIADRRQAGEEFEM